MSGSPPINLNLAAAADATQGVQDDDKIGDNIAGGFGKLPTWLPLLVIGTGFVLGVLWIARQVMNDGRKQSHA